MYSDYLAISVQLYYNNITAAPSDQSLCTIQLQNVPSSITASTLINFIYRQLINNSSTINSIGFDDLNFDLLYKGSLLYLYESLNALTDSQCSIVCCITRIPVKDKANTSKSRSQLSSSNDVDVSHIYRMVSSDMLAPLIEMGFTADRSRKALLLSMFNAELAVEWLFNHSDDPDIDEPLSHRQLYSINRVLGLFGHTHNSSANRLGRVIGSSGLAPMELLSSVGLSRSAGLIHIDDITSVNAVSGASSRYTNEIDDRIQQSIDSNICTYNVTGNKFAAQPYRCCVTCNLIQGQGVCLACANICHKGHELGEIIESDNFFCDCRESKTPCIAVKRNQNATRNKYNTYTPNITYNSTQPYQFTRYVDYVKCTVKQIFPDENTMKQVFDTICSTGNESMIELWTFLQSYYNNNNQHDSNYLNKIHQIIYDHDWFSISDSINQSFILFISTVHFTNHVITKQLLHQLLNNLSYNRDAEFGMNFLTNITSNVQNAPLIAEHQSQLCNLLINLYDKQAITLKQCTDILGNVCLLASTCNEFDIITLFDTSNECLLHATTNLSDNTPCSLMHALTILCIRLHPHQFNQKYITHNLIQTLEIISCNRYNNGRYARLLLNIAQQII